MLPPWKVHNMSGMCESFQSFATFVANLKHASRLSFRPSATTCSTSQRERHCSCDVLGVLKLRSRAPVFQAQRDCLQRVQPSEQLRRVLPCQQQLLAGAGGEQLQRRRRQRPSGAVPGIVQLVARLQVQKGRRRSTIGSKGISRLSDWPSSQQVQGSSAVCEDSSQLRGAGGAEELMSQPNNYPFHLTLTLVNSLTSATARTASVTLLHNLLTV